MAKEVTITKEVFEEICKEALPHIVCLQESLRKHGVKELGSVTFGSDGYVTFGIFNTGWDMVKTESDEKTRIRHEYELKEVL